MKKAALTDAIAEAQRFLDRARLCDKSSKAYEKQRPDTAHFRHIDLDLATHTAAVRRSSMDLTRALSALRK